MGIRHNRVLLGKISLLLVMLLVVGLGGLGCVGIKSTPEGGSGGVIANGTLYLSPTLKSGGGLGCAPSPMEGKLIALNASSGARLWEVPMETSKAAGGFGCAPASTSVAIYGTPAVAEDLVYVGSYDGKIYAFNSGSGALRWVYPRQGNLQPIVGAPVVVEGKVYIGCSDGKVYALDAATGDKQWEFPTGDKIWSTPTIDGSTLYIGSLDKSLYALGAADGSKKWEFKTEGAIVSTPLVYNNKVYIGSVDRYFYAIDATNGSLRWRSKLEAGSWFWAKPIVYNNTIYGGNLDGKIYILNAENGNKIAEFDLGSPVSSSPVLVDSSIIIVSEEGKVYALDTGSNQIKQLTDLKEKVYAPLSASDGVVYVHTQKHDTLYALNAQTGVTLWSLPLSSK